MPLLFVAFLSADLAAVPLSSAALPLSVYCTVVFLGHLLHGREGCLSTGCRVVMHSTVAVGYETQSTWAASQCHRRKAVLCCAVLCCAVLCCAASGVKAQGLWLSTTDPSRVFVGLNRRQKSVFDIYSLDLRSQQMTLDTVNPGNVTAWVVNPDFRIGVRTCACCFDWYQLRSRWQLCYVEVSAWISMCMSVFGVRLAALSGGT
jgi:hypothetical protein